MKKLAVMMMVLGMLGFATVHASDVSDLEDLALPSDSYWNGSGLEGSYSGTDAFTSGTASLNNFYAYDADYMYSSWGGFAFSNITDTTSAGFAAQYNAIPGSGQDNSDNYVIGYCNTFAAGQPEITFENPQVVSGAYVTNTNYAYYSMLNGDGFAKKFGGASGDDADWFLLRVTGKDADGNATGTVNFYLADFRFADNADDYIVADWRLVDLSSLGTVKTLEFALTSSDSHPTFGMNTPAYFAMDSLGGSADFEGLTLAPESYWNGSDLDGSYTATDAFTSGIATYNNYYAYDADYMFSSWEGFAYSNITDTATKGFSAQYNAITGHGHSGSNYAIGYCGSFASIPPTLTFKTARTISAARVTNTSYGYYSMLDGDGFAKKFGGASGDDADWFLLTVTGKDVDGNATGTVDFYLADFRFADNADDYIIRDWAMVELKSLGEVKTLEFALTSSDSDPVWGMNTPAYFAIDSVNDYDDDGDGYSEVEGDCDDSNPDINPDAIDVCGDGIDQDCSGSDLSCEDDEDDDNWLKGCFIGVSGSSSNY